MIVRMMTGMNCRVIKSRRIHGHVDRALIIVLREVADMFLCISESKLKLMLYQVKIHYGIRAQSVSMKIKCSCKTISTLKHNVCF